MGRDELDVWVQGRYAGALSQHESALTFTYDPAYRAERYSPALSVSMPKSRASFDGDVPRRWFDNLLPDNDNVRDRWAAEFGERRVTAFNLLRHMGQDCAGAVQVMPDGVAPDAAGDGEHVPDGEIEQRLRALRQDNAAWTFANHGGRWSLGGAQGKFALAQMPDGTWEEPTGRAASTHIFKVGVHRFAHGDVAEFVTTRSAALLGLDVAHTEIRRFGDESAIVSRRYDRHVGPDAPVTRLHQEDLCQALGLSRALKYEADAGPGVESISALLARAVDPRDLASARESFALSLIFNWLVAGTDAHAMNYSLLHFGPRVLMAPLYDLTSAALVMSAKEVQFDARLAMKLGGEYKIRDIQVRHLQRAAATVGMDSDWVLDTAHRFATTLPAAVEQALDEVGDVVSQNKRGEFSMGMFDRLTAARRTLGARANSQGRGTRATPPSAAEAPPAVAGRSREPVWVAAHVRGSRSIDGYWRNRPGRT